MAENGKTPKKNGRPVKVIDWAQFDRLCGLHCTQREIAAFFDCSVDAIQAACIRDFGVSFTDRYEQKADLGRISLRRTQFKMADRGNATMLIWLGKQWLGQQDQTRPSDDDEPISLAYDPKTVGNDK